MADGARSTMDPACVVHPQPLLRLEMRAKEEINILYHKMRGEANPADFFT